MPRKYRTILNSILPPKARKRLLSIGIACASACATLFILFLAYQGLLFARRWFSWLDTLLGPRPIAAFRIPFSAPSPDPGMAFNKNGLVFASFSDLFSGTAWLDMQKTTLYHDTLTTAFTYPPQYAWDMTSPAQKPSGDAENSSKVCIDSACLSHDGTRLFLNDAPLQIPSEAGGSSLFSLSIGSLRDSWSIGIVTKSGKIYRAAAYILDRSGSFERIAALDVQPIQSKHAGRLALGGTRDDMLALYSSYEPIAYRIRAGKAEDIGSFFGIRMMNNGFYPVITRLDDGKDAHWYVASRTMRNPKLIKLFQNGTKDLQGALDLTPKLFQGAMAQGLLDDARMDGKFPVLSFTVINGDGNAESWRFIDKGFSKDKDFEICSANLSPATNPVLVAKMLDTVLVSPVGEKIKLFLSNNGTDWQKESIDSDLYFKDSNARNVFWKATITPEDDNPFSSIYFDRIRIDYWIRKSS
jgi:hypothetical protein